MAATICSALARPAAARETTVRRSSTCSIIARGAAPRTPTQSPTAGNAAAFVAFNKVFSPQYLVWLFPLVPLVRGRRGLWATVLLGLVTALTQVWEPYHYPALYKHGAAWVSGVLLARDLLVVCLLALLVWPRRSASTVPAEELEPAGAAVV